MEGVGSVGFGVRWVVVDFEEDAVDACGHGGAGQDRDELGLASGDSVGGRGSLDGVGGVEDHRGKGAHDGERAHVDDEVVVAEAGTALGEGDAGVAGVANLFDGVAHVEGGDELALLDVDGSASLGGGDEEVGLAAEEGRDLEDVDGFAYGAAILGGVDVGEDGEAGGFGYGAENAAAFGEAGAAEASDGGAVSFVVAGFEDVGDAEVGGDALDGVGHGAGVVLGLDDAGAGDEEEFAAAYGDGADIEGIGHMDYLTTVRNGMDRAGRTSYRQGHRWECGTWRLEMILLSLFVVVLGAGVHGQAQAAASAPAPAPVTEVMAMASVKPGVALPDVMKLVPEEVRGVAQLYMNGKIEQWYTRGDGKGQIFFLRAKTIDEAKAIFADLPAVKAGYVVVEYIPVGPYSPLRFLMRQGSVEGAAQH